MPFYAASIIGAVLQKQGRDASHADASRGRLDRLMVFKSLLCSMPHGVHMQRGALHLARPPSPTEHSVHSAANLLCTCRTVM